jgi:hypothetical protein
VESELNDAATATVTSISFRTRGDNFSKAPLLCYAREGPVGSRSEARVNSQPCQGRRVMGHAGMAWVGLGFRLCALLLILILIRRFDLIWLFKCFHVFLTTQGWISINSIGSIVFFSSQSRCASLLIKADHARLL